MRRPLVLVIGLWLLASAAGGEELFVSLQGNDRWSGRSSEPNAAGTDGPLATLEGAREAIRARRRGGSAAGTAFTVSIRGGTYYLDRPFRLEPQDSGTAQAPVTYRAYRDERAVLSGGRPVSGFSASMAAGRPTLVAYLPEVASGSWRFTQLFVNGRRASRPRLPREGTYRIAGLPDASAATPWNQGQDRFRYSGRDVEGWKNLGDVEIVALHFWVESRMPIASVDAESHVVDLAVQSVFRLTDDFGQEGARYYVENVAEALDEPGEWYLDRPTGRLTYLPRPGEEGGHAVFVAPALETLVSVEGNPADGTPVEHVRFVGLVFSHTQSTAGNSTQAAVGVPGALTFSWATGCSLEGCEITAIGTYGVEIGYGCRDIEIRGSGFRDLGAGGIKIGRGSRNTVVEDNEISDGGKIYRSAVGVWIGDSGGNRVAHNHIHDLDYTGISVGWVWGYGLSFARDNVIEANHIHHIGRGVLSDLAGIYTLGVSPGTVIRNNLVHDCVSWGYGGWGLYSDEGSSFILVEDNVVYNTKSGGFHHHYGRENVIRNNIFAFGEQQQLERTRAEGHVSFTFERNIVTYRSGVLLKGTWSDDRFTMDGNLYWDERWGRGLQARPGAIDFAGASRRQWQRRKHDTRSLFLDPLFADAAGGDFRIGAASPALRLGFRPIDLTGVGPRVPPGRP